MSLSSLWRIASLLIIISHVLAESTDTIQSSQTHLRSEVVRRLQAKTPTALPISLPTNAPTAVPSGCSNQPGSSVRCPLSQNEFTTIRIQQILTADAFPENPSPGQERLTAAFVYQQKPFFKNLLKAADYAQWEAYSARATSNKLPWLPYDLLKANIMVGFGQPSGSRLSASALEKHAEIEIEEVRDLAVGEGQRALGGGGCRRLAEQGSGKGIELLGGGAACPPPPPSPFKPEILVTYYYNFVPANLGFSSRNAARDSLNAAVNLWKPFTDKKGYQAMFNKKLNGPDFINTPIFSVVGLATSALSVSDAVFSNGNPTEAPVGLPASASSGLKNAQGMPYFAYIFVVLFLLLALGMIYFFCSKKSKILDSKIEDTFFTGKKQDEELLKAQSKQQQATLAKFEQELMGGPVFPPPPGMSPSQQHRKSMGGEPGMGYPPGMDPRMSMGSHLPSPSRRMSSSPYA